MNTSHFVRRSAVPVLLLSCVAWLLRVGAVNALCVGDCNGDRTVAVNELVSGVGTTLGETTVDTCPAIECNSSGLGILINCMVVAVNNALNGCGPAEPGGDGACCVGACDLAQEQCRPSEQGFCCNYAQSAAIALPISWCPPGEYDPATLQCGACVDACTELPIETPTPPPSPAPTEPSEGVCFTASDTCMGEGFATSQITCCAVSQFGGLPGAISWCPAGKPDSLSECPACTDPCEGLSTPTPGELRWHRACGPPVVAYPGNPCPFDVTRCTTQRLDDPCTEPSALCCEADSRCTFDMCNDGLICSTEAPRACPISRRRYKHDIEYLGQSGLEQLHHELLAIKLANFRYNSESSATQPHLGFIIEDVEPSQCVDSARDRVDLYGYLSMAVGAIQVQARQIEALRKEIDALRDELDQARQKVAPQRDS